MGRVDRGVQCTLVYYYGSERKRVAPARQLLCGLYDPKAERNGPCIVFIPLLMAMWGRTRTPMDDNRKVANRRDGVYSISDIRRLRGIIGSRSAHGPRVGRRMMSMSAGAARRWKLEVGVLRGMISNRDHERRTFHGPSLTSSNNRPINSFFGLHRRCALPSYWRIVPPRLPYFLKSSSVHLFSLSTTKFTSPPARLLFIRQHSVSVLSLSINIVSPNFLSSFFLSGLLHPQSTITQVHTYSTFRAYFILYR